MSLSLLHLNLNFVFFKEYSAGNIYCIKISKYNLANLYVCVHLDFSVSSCSDIQLLSPNHLWSKIYQGDKINQVFENIKQNETVLDFAHVKSEIRVINDMGQLFKDMYPLRIVIQTLMN